MTKTKQPKAAKKCWSESFGVYGAKIRIAEREPGGVLYLLWLDNQGKQQKRSLGHRDRRLGRKHALELAGAIAAPAGGAKPEKPAGAMRWKGSQPNKVWTSRVTKAPVDEVWAQTLERLDA